MHTALAIVNFACLLINIIVTLTSKPGRPQLIGTAIGSVVEVLIGLALLNVI